MKLSDTTCARTQAGIRTLISSSSAAREWQLAGSFRIHLVGMYCHKFGREWDSEGARECDYLHHIDLALSGSRRVVLGDRSYHLQPAQAWFLPGNTPVIRQCSEVCEVLFFKFFCEWLPGVDPLLDWPGREPRLIGAIDPDHWRSFLEPGRSIGMVDLLELRACLLTWLARALPELDEVTSGHLATHTQFTGVFRHIENHLGADLRLTSLAEIHGTSQGAFSVAFTRSTGVSPKEYLTRRLNQEAIKLVINTDLKMKEIADRLRFGDEFYFSRFFQRFNGMPPTRYRASFRPSGTTPRASQQPAR